MRVHKEVLFTFVHRYFSEHVFISVVEIIVDFLSSFGYR